jgi:hypothetical protein
VVRVDLVLHLHRLHDAEELTRCDDIALRDAHRKNRSLHRARHRLACAGGARARSLAPAPRELGPGRLGLDDRDAEEAPVDFYFLGARTASSAVRRRR